MPRDEFSDVVPELAAEGLTLREISRETGLDYDAVRHRLRRAGTRAPAEGALTVRQKVQGMRPLDAVEYLLDCLEQIEICEMDTRLPDPTGLGLTLRQRRLFAALCLVPCRSVSKSALYRAVYFDLHPGDEPPGEKIIDVFICQVRAKLRPEIGNIFTDRGFGWGFNPGPDFAFPAGFRL